MVYPDFAFYPVTKIILIIIHCIVVIVAYYWGADIILHIYQKNVTFTRKLLFSFLSAIILNILVVYGAAYVSNCPTYAIRVFTDSSVLNAGSIIFKLFAIINPFSYFIMYWLGLHVLQLPRYKSVKIMQLFYNYCVFWVLITITICNNCFPVTNDLRGWNYLRDIFSLLCGIPIGYLIIRLAQYVVRRAKLYMDYADNTVISNLTQEKCKNFLLCVVFYVIVECFLNYPLNDGMHFVFLSIFGCCYVAVMIVTDYANMSKKKLLNKEEDIMALNQSIDEFRGIKHDFFNILQTYSGYLEIEDYHKLAAYHQKVTSATAHVSTRLELSERLAENPAFFSLLFQKIDITQKEEIMMNVALLCDMCEINMDEIEFCQIMSILLDNAIEAAMETVSKRIDISSLEKTDGSKLIIISNDILTDINIDKVFISGYTTKKGHEGQGLAVVRNIIDNCELSTISVASQKKCFTVYLEIKPNKAHEKRTHNNMTHPNNAEHSSHVKNDKTDASR